ncbi:Golgi resident protein GCP60 [Parasteatoda tepidariorum]|uniref:Golgi resident protein GCP60 n=1 Tax=Parasteatoda tepidariorum TaxID=114398 RepID=A0A2L2YG60_PARTP|nr:Golgi resident protein GCP60 [Parasteatoda tepidariorum]
MDASVNGDPVNVCVQNNINSIEKDTLNSISPSNDSESSDEFLETWGFNTDELYSLATKFLKEKEGKAFPLSYKDKLSLVAYTQQVLHGKFIEEKYPAVGYLDVIGRDRKLAWQSLGDMSKKDGKAHYIKLLNEVCHLFRPFVLAHKCDLEEKERKRIEEEEKRRLEAEEEERLRLEEEEEERLEEERLREEKERQKQNNQKRAIQEALNRQTFQQFKAYAEKQFPGDPEQQAVLVRQLQEQHYQQYMQQVLQEQLSPPVLSHKSEVKMTQVPQDNGLQPTRESSPEPSEDEIADPLPVAAAHMWTRKDITQFKEAIRKEGGDGIIKVGHGETVTVRVPTHDDGSCLFWEFATDSFDLGFGVYFEWTRSPDAQVTVHISESEDEEDDDDELEQVRSDIEKGVTLQDKPPLSVIIPVYRRDCHEEVYAGSHNYPGQGVYLLKFDNSYSLWRSKTLYYRVYYTR